MIKIEESKLRKIIRTEYMQMMIESLNESEGLDARDVVTRIIRKHSMNLHNMVRSGFPEKEAEQIFQMSIEDAANSILDVREDMYPGLSDEEAEKARLILIRIADESKRKQASLDKQG